MKIKKAGVANIGEEELAQTIMKIRTRATARVEAEALFPHGSENRKGDVDLLRSLFVQAPAATTMSPQLLSKQAAVEEEYFNYSPLLTPHLDEFFKTAEVSQLTEAQKKYPELLKAAAAPGVGSVPSPISKQTRKATSESKGGTTPAQSSLSGGSR